MPRKNRTSPLEDMLNLVALMPWWVGVAIAVVGYLVLHRLAIPAQVTASPTVQVASLLAPVIAGFANIGQYILPVVGLAGAFMSFLGQKKRAGLVSHVAQAPCADVLDGMSWQKFEMLVGEAFRLQGYQVTETGGGGADGGVDLVLRKDKEKFLVQCKQWKAYKVGVDVVRELYGVMAAKGATGGFVVTSGRFTREASAFANGRNVRLIDGKQLLGLIQQAQNSVTSRASAARKSAPTPASAQAHAAVMCPVCRSDMVKRTAKKGAHAGTAFWGCAHYPACKGTRPLG